MSDASVARASLALLPRLGGGMLAALLIVTIGTNLIDFATLPAAGQRPGAAFAASAILRVGFVFWLSFVVQRRLVEPQAGFGLDRAFWRFLVLQLLLLVGILAVRALVLKLIPPAPTLAAEWLANFAALAIWAILSIRLLAWNAALAAGAPFDALSGLWSGLRRDDSRLIGAFAVLVLPPAALHLAFTLIGVRVPVAARPLAFLCIVDGLVSALQLALNCAVAAVALRLATGREAR